MSGNGSGRISEILNKYQGLLLGDWLRELEASASGRRADLIRPEELREQCSNFLRLTNEALQKDSAGNVNSQAWDEVRGLLGDISRSRAFQGFTPSETATFVFSFKKPLFDALRKELGTNPQELAQAFWNATELLDQLGLYTTEVFQRSREEIIFRQQQEMLELSTPVVELWKGIVALPLIGTLDSARTQVVMETLLQRIVETGSQIAIIDITGVPTVDTLVAQHLMKTVAAARLMGAECIISGIRPQIASTIVHLGVDLKDVMTKASLSSALLLALKKLNYSLEKQGARGGFEAPGL